MILNLNERYDMTDCTVYVGNLKEHAKFRREGGDWNFNRPTALTDDFPPMRGHYNSTYRDWVIDEGIAIQQTDYGCWVARISKVQLQRFIVHAYHGDEDLSWVKGGLGRILTQINALTDDGDLCLVATEF